MFLVDIEIDGSLAECVIKHTQVLPLTMSVVGNLCLCVLPHSFEALLDHFLK